MLEDGVHSLAYGHFAIKANEVKSEEKEEEEVQIMTAAEARLKRYPLYKHRTVPTGLDPLQMFTSAIETRAATMLNIPLHAQTLPARPVKQNEPDLLSYVIDDSQ
ncbi:MAG: hypothetical protein FD143_3315 [Ignavibacteria bacterium]|nr:MAG: hypothetical protein FD143_3315 [Ignavibacteria bacterium]